MVPVEADQPLRGTGLLLQAEYLPHEALHLPDAQLVQHIGDEDAVLIGEVRLLHHRNPVEEIVDDLQLGLLAVLDAGVLSNLDAPSLLQIKLQRGGDYMEEIFPIDSRGQ